MSTAPNPWSRRDFLAASASLCAAGVLNSTSAHVWHAQPDRQTPADRPDALPSITLGRTGRTVPRLGLGCFPIGGLASEEDAAAVLDAALAAGVRYLDTAPSYQRGRSESRVGAALARWKESHGPDWRSDFYVATKTLERNADAARRELESSLARLGLDHVDCIQCHEIHDDWQKLFDNDGALAGLEKARDEGLTKHIGITCHRDPSYAVNAIKRFPFLTALVPINPIDVQHHSFVRGFLPFAVENNVSVIAMKIFGGGFLLNTQTESGQPAYTPGDLLRYALAQPGVAVCVPGCDKIEHVAADVAAVSAFAQPEPDWLAAMEARAGKHQGKSTEWYKDD